VSVTQCIQPQHLQLNKRHTSRRYECHMMYSPSRRPMSRDTPIQHDVHSVICKLVSVLRRAKMVSAAFCIKSPCRCTLTSVNDMGTHMPAFVKKCEQPYGLVLRNYSPVARRHEKALSVSDCPPKVCHRDSIREVRSCP